MVGKSRAVVLALDLGSSSVRALAFTATGKRVPGSLKRAQLVLYYTPEGHAELDPDLLLEKVVGVLSAASDVLERKGLSVAAVVMSCFWHSLVGLDRRGRPLTSVLVWADMRSRNQAAHLRTFLKEGAYRQRTGCYLHPAYLPSKILWLKEERPRIFDRVSRWVSVDGYLLGRLQGDYGSSHPMAAGTGLYHQGTRDWDEATLEALEVSRDRLPGLRSMEEPRTGLRPAYKEVLAPIGKTPIFPALPDGYCAQLGSSGRRTGQAVLTLGTSGALRVMVQGDRLPKVPKGLWCYRVEKDRFLVGGAVNNVGNLLVWLQQTLDLPKWSNRLHIHKGEDPDSVVLQADPNRLPGSHGLTVLPFLQGERSPQWFLEASGVVAGLKSTTTAEDIYTAFLEALSFQFGRVFQPMEKKGLVRAEAVNVSGGIRDPTLFTILASVMNRPIHVLAEEEASALGAATWAWSRLGLRPDPERPSDIVCRSKPDRACAAKYREEAKRQEALAGLFRKHGTFA